jgi:hypothetical protein
VKLTEYLEEMRGSLRRSSPRVSIGEVLWSWVGAFLGILTLA